MFVGGFRFVFNKLDERATGSKARSMKPAPCAKKHSKLMADAKKAKEADAAADDIIKRAKADADAMMKQAKADLKAKVAARSTG